MNTVNNNQLDSLKSIPKISIVMPSYNQDKYIERSILSVLNQGYQNLEFIIIDGGSADRTNEIIAKYKSQISIYISEKDKGQSDALNKGFSLASGDIYGWLNSDDIYLPGTFHLVVESFWQNPKKRIVFGDWLSIDEDDNILERNYAFDFNLNHFKYEGFHLNAQSMFWESYVHRTFSGYDIDLFNTMDYQMILEFGMKNSQEDFLRVPAIFGAFRRYLGQKTAGFTPRVVHEQAYIAKKYNIKHRFNFLGFFIRTYFRFRRAFWYFKRGGIIELKRRIINAYFKSL